MDVFSELSRLGILVSDGAWGTMLQSGSGERGDAPERLNLTDPGRVSSVAEAYLESGAQLIITNSFGGSRLKLESYGLADRVHDINVAAARLSKQAGKGNHIVFGSVGPTGKFLEPLGDISQEAMTDCFAEQIEALVEGGVDGVVVETMSDLDEAACAVRAAKRVCDLPVACSFAFDPVRDGFRTMMGVSPAQVVSVMEPLGVSFIGANCGSIALNQMVELVGSFAQLTSLPIWVRPNAGIPQLVDGMTVFGEQPEALGEAAKHLVGAGAKVIGGCCGTTPAHIKAIALALTGISARS